MLEAALQHHFARSALLEQALTHSSHAHEASDALAPDESSGEKISPCAGDNEIMEFLGDAVLGFVTRKRCSRIFQGSMKVSFRRCGHTW